MIGAIVLKLGNRRAWKAFNRRNLDYFEPYVAENVVYDVQGTPPTGGRFVGKAAWREANQRWMDSLRSFNVRLIHEALTRPWALGLTNTILTEYEVTETTHDGRTLRTRGVDVSELRRGKLVSHRTYTFDLGDEGALRRPAAERAGPLGLSSGSGGDDRIRTGE